MSKQAQSLAKLGDFNLSHRSAEAVLMQDPLCLEAILIKGESLYNNCEFEHAMVVFSKGLRISPGFEGFITGIAKVTFENMTSSTTTMLYCNLHFSAGKRSRTRSCRKMFSASLESLCY